MIPITNIKPALGLIRWFLIKTGYAGITLPPFGIYILQNRINDNRLIKHELAHWNQYKCMGLLRFYSTYIFYHFRYGYQNNPMEIEARQVENS